MLQIKNNIVKSRNPHGHELAVKEDIAKLICNYYIISPKPKMCGYRFQFVGLEIEVFGRIIASNRKLVRI